MSYATLNLLHSLLFSGFTARVRTGRAWVKWMLPELAAGTVSLDAALIALDLGLAPAQVMERVHTGCLTARCEQGIGADAGRLRLTFYYERRRLRLVIDQGGRILQRSVAHLPRRGGRRELPRSSPPSETSRHHD